MWPMGGYASDEQVPQLCTDFKQAFKKPFPLLFLRQSTLKVKSSNEELEMR